MSRAVAPFPRHLLPNEADDVTLDDDPTDERDRFVTLADMDAALTPILEALDGILSHVGPEAQRNRARREAALLASVVVGIGCVGLGALDLQGASDVTIGILGGLILAAVVSVVAVLGRVHVSAKAPGVEVNAGGSTGGAT